MASSTSTASELRKAFTDFFSAKNHSLVASAPIVPADPSLLFTVAGMVPFKQYFLGLEEPPYKRAVSVQKCLRAGGKHNDLEEIGHTSRHLSFFEMMGNFSFGDYFKEDAIIWAWEFSTQILKFDPKDIWVTIHISDDEAENIWQQKTDVNPDQIQRLDEPNYWKMADTGPCGPCSELHLDRGEAFGRAGGPKNGDSDRYVEFWNLVFMQFEQKEDGSKVELPNPSIDTGAGLERLLALMADADTVFDVGDLGELMKVARELAGGEKSSQKSPEASQEVSLRILVEHSRAAAFVIQDGIIPSNEDRGYVLRRIIRRAIRHAHLAGIYNNAQSAILPLAEMAINLVKDDYPQLLQNQEKILSVLKNEEARFLQTLETGGQLLEKSLKTANSKSLSGETIFTLHDTYGFPYDLTDEIAKEAGFKLDRKGFEEEMEKQKQRARADHKVKSAKGQGVGVQESYLQELAGVATTEFLQEYETTAKVLVVTDDGLVLDRTSFYAESGGQVGDIGVISSKANGTGAAETVEVIDTIYGSPGVVFHKTKSRPAFEVGDEVVAKIDGERRDSTRRHHTATHILHWALKEALGSHVSPQGSLVQPNRLRFDFSHWEALSSDELANIEDICNTEILSNQPVRHFETTRAEADAMGAAAFFEEKYGDIVKVLEAGKNSIELCGGTHVSALGDIGPLKIVSESSIGANIRRVEAVCGPLPVELLRKQDQTVLTAADILGVAAGDLIEGAKKRSQELKEVRQELGQLKSQGAMSQIDDLAELAKNQVLVQRIQGVDRDTLRKMAITLKDKKNLNIVILGAAVEGGGAALVATIKPDVVAGLKAGELLAEPAKLISGGGGKGDDLAVAGGKDVEGIDAALKLAEEIAIEKTSKDK